MSLKRVARQHAMLFAVRAFGRGYALLGDLGAKIVAMRPGTDPYPIYEQVRARGDLVSSRVRLHMTASYHLTNSILRDSRLGVGGREDVMTDGLLLRDDNGRRPVHPLDDSFLSLDPPDHTRLRRTVAPWFTPRALRERTPEIERLTGKFLDELDSGTNGDSWDLIGDFAVRVPIKVICDLFGIPEIDYPRFARWGAVLGASLDGVRTVPELRQLRATLVEMEAFFDRLIETRRRQPGDDIVSAVVQSAPDGIEPAREDMLATCQLLLVAGFETTVNLVGNGVLALLGDPAARAEFVTDPAGLAPNLVEETLRLDSPVQYTARIVQQPVTLAGVELPVNSMVVPLVAAANTAGSRFADPHRLDLHRPNSKDHLAFSAGVHYCLGAGLARIEAAAAFRVLFERFPDLRQAGPVVRRPSRNIRGALRLPVRGNTRGKVTIALGTR
jgi:cytochrome P450